MAALRGCAIPIRGDELARRKAARWCGLSVFDTCHGAFVELFARAEGSIGNTKRYAAYSGEEGSTETI
jgi:hypothetical protein